MRRAREAKQALSDGEEGAPVSPSPLSSSSFAPPASRRPLWPSGRSSVALVLVLVGLLVVAANFASTWRASVFPQLRSRVEDSAPEDEPDASWTLQERADLAAALTDAQKREMEAQLLYSLYMAGQQTSEPRGIVLPMFDGIATLGVSLIMELRAMNIQLPIEIPHCGDLDARYRQTLLEQEELGTLYFVDVCKRAERSASLLPGEESRKLFCRSDRECHGRFRNFDVKLLAVTYSRFEELMLLDADTIFFQDPTPLWESRKFLETGTLFFHDRLSQEDMYLGLPMKSKPGVNDLNNYMSSFDVAPYRFLDHISRPPRTVANTIPVTLHFDASDHLLTSHAWNHRAGHEMDSSFVLWSKKRQPRATTILSSFAALNDVRRPPSYGDKELFFIACELAETKYAFSDFGVGGVGTDFRDFGEDNSTVCGQAAHYWPTKEDSVGGSLLYLNSDDILKYDPWHKSVYFSKARPAEFYPGSFKERNLPQECPFDVTGVKFSQAMNNRVSLRQRFHDIAVAWHPNTPKLKEEEGK